MEGPLDPELLRRMESDCRDLGHIIGEAIDQDGRHKGFLLFIFSFEGPEATWISNAQREGMIEALEEFIRKLKRGEATLPSHEN
jgi:hypothetical protein